MDIILSGAIADLEEALETMEKNKSTSVTFTQEEIIVLLNLLNKIKI